MSTEKMPDWLDEMPDWLDDALDAGWKEFVKEIQAKNDLSNNRLFKVLSEIKGEPFVNDLKNVLKTVGEHTFLQIVRKPDGFPFADKRWVTIPQVWIEQKSSAYYGMTGSICVQVKYNRWVKLSYTIEQLKKII